MLGTNMNRLFAICGAIFLVSAALSGFDHLYGETGSISKIAHIFAVFSFIGLIVLLMRGYFIRKAQEAAMRQGKDMALQGVKTAITGGNAVKGALLDAALDQAQKIPVGKIAGAIAGQAKKVSPTKAASAVAGVAKKVSPTKAASALADQAKKIPFGKLLPGRKKKGDS